MTLIIQSLSTFSIVNIEWIAKACILFITHFGGIYYILQLITIYSVFEILVREVGGYLVFWSTK
jgi:hypothetical protein